MWFSRRRHTVRGIFYTACPQIIGDLKYEFGYGEQSGWMYTVNGEYPSVHAGAYELNDGDTVEFVYTVSAGTWEDTSTGDN